MKVFADFSCDMKQYVAMGKRASALALFVSCCFFSYILVAFAVIAVLFSTGVIGKIVVGSIFLALVAFVFVLSFLRLPKQMKKNFLMQSTDGVLHQTVEIVGNSLVVTNVGNGNVSEYGRSDVKKCVLRKDFFTVYFSNGSSLFVPVCEGTSALYGALTDSAQFDSAALANPQPQHEEQPRPTDVLSYEYTLTQESAVKMITKINAARTKILWLCVVLFTVVAAWFIFYAFTREGETVRCSVSAVMFFSLAILFVYMYATAAVNSKRNGEKCFEMNNVGGEMRYRVELSQQGIVVVNVLKTTRNSFRLADMTRVAKYRDFFSVEFVTNQVLPIPFNTETAKLCDVLTAALPKPLTRLK